MIAYSITFSDPSTIEDLIHALGDCGLFQVIFVIVTHGAILANVWSSWFMSFGNYDPGWYCNDTFIDIYNHSQSLSNIRSTNLNYSLNFTAQVLNHSRSCSVFDHCENVIYNKDSSTIVTEWDLSCERHWITSLIISVQMGGSIIGNFIAGFFNNKFGRKKAHFGGLAVHCFLNIITAYSNSWQMFTVMRFFLGITGNYINVSCDVFPLEMVTNRWRAIVSALPFSNFSGTLFAVVAMFLRDWRMLHLATAMATLILFLPVFWIPESLRWLAIKGKTDKACQVVDKIASINRKECPNKEIIIRRISESCSSTQSTNSSMLDIYKNGFWKTTVILTYSLISAVVCYIVFTFGVKNLSGNFYLNLLLFSLTPLVIVPMLPFVINSIGRKLSQLIIIGSQCVFCVSLASLDAWDLDDNVRGTIELVISIAMFTFTNAQWSLAILGNIELYPTTLRSLGYSHSNGVSKIFAMAAPFLIPQNNESIMIPYVILAIMCGLNFVLNLFLPETKDTQLQDYASISD